MALLVVAVGIWLVLNRRPAPDLSLQRVQKAGVIVIGLDPKNPQVAARMATAFRSWRTMESGRRAKAEAALNRIQRTPGLSRDVADIVERALG